MADDSDDKTEDPTQKRLDDAHARGDVAKSQEVTTWFMLLGSAIIFAGMAPSTGANLTASLKILMGNADRFEVGGAAFGNFFNGLALSLLGHRVREMLGGFEYWAREGLPVATAEGVRRPAVELADLLTG